MANRLPTYWAVEAPKDRTDPRFKKVINYLNKLSGGLTGRDYKFYGDDGRYFNAGDCWNNLASFKNKVTLITLDQFIEMTEGPEVINHFKFY